MYNNSYEIFMFLVKLILSIYIFNKIYQVNFFKYFIFLYDSFYFVTILLNSFVIKTIPTYYIIIYVEEYVRKVAVMQIISH